tara:strand:+ start:69 stop:305 length:237 start_codon:yes stop_codon:yes gene_type:complete
MKRLINKWQERNLKLLYDIATGLWYGRRMIKIWKEMSLEEREKFAEKHKFPYLILTKDSSILHAALREATERLKKDLL